jgi:hypothetical protein
MNEMKNRGVGDILIAVVDGLKGFPEAITAVFPDATVQTCIVHLLRQSLAFASYKDRKAVAAALKTVYRATDAVTGEAALTAFEAGFWGQKYPAISQSWSQWRSTRRLRRSGCTGNNRKTSNAFWTWKRSRPATRQAWRSVATPPAILTIVSLPRS